MIYKSVDELDHFSFRDARIEKCERLEKGLLLELEAVIVCADNSQNSNFTDSYAGPLHLRLLGAQIQKAVKEGYKYYDANDVLLEEVPDTPLTEEETDALLKGCSGYDLFDVVKVEDSQNDTGKQLYLFGVDKDEDTTYWLQIVFEKAVAERDKYLNRVQKL